MNTSPNTQRPQISAKGLTKTFAGKISSITACEDVSFDVNKGEFFCILGPSGCGKTTLLRTIASLDTPTSGTLTINSTPNETEANIGMVFQERGIFPWMTVAENIHFLLQNNPCMKGKDIKAITNEYVKKVDLEKFSSYYPHQISGGMKQRVSIARSFANDPDILLMDEPFVFLDYQTRISLQELLLTIWQGTQKTVVFVTHDIEEAVILADRILVMSAHPGSVKKIIDVNFPRPRHVHDIRKMPEYIQHVDEISNMIREEMLGLDVDHSMDSASPVERIK